MRRFSLSAVLTAPLIGLVGVPAAVLAAPQPPQQAQTQAKPAATPSGVPLAPAVLGPRPRLNPKVEPQAATQLKSGVRDLAAPNILALPTKAEMVRIDQLRPLGLADVENLVEVNNPSLKAIASQVDQAKSNLRAQLALWYPTLALSSSALPSYITGENYSNTAGTQANSKINRSGFDATLEAQYALINPQRVPAVAQARDQYEKAKYQYVVSLRDLRLQAAQAYFDLQQIGRAHV